jgi:type IV secretion system protein VirB1
MDLLTLIATCAPLVAPTTLKAIVLEESRGHPYAIHDGKTHRALFPKTRAEAIATARRLLAQGSRIDAGLSQINSENWAWLGLTPETVFIPCTNLRAGERVLLEAYTHAPYTVEAAISRYNTGHATRGVSNGYVARVRAWMPKPPPDRHYEGSAPRAVEQARVKATPGRFETVADGFGAGG